MKFAARTPGAASLQSQSVVAGAVAWPCRLLLPRRDALLGDEGAAEADAVVASLVSGCAFAPEMLMPARAAGQNDVQHCRRFRARVWEGRRSRRLFSR